MQAFSAQAELYFNPRFLADDPAAVADLSDLKRVRRCRRAPIASISI
jgi:outer membrane usher protein FimD/PapC